MALDGLLKSIERGAVETAPRNGRIKWETVVGWLVAALLAYGAVNARVAVLESRVQDGSSRMERIEQKLDRIWERVK